MERYHHSLVSLYDVHKDWNCYNLLAYVLRNVTYVHIFCTMCFFEHNDEVLYKFHVEQRCVEMKCQLDATEVFIADLIACSTCFGHQYAYHQELKSIIQWLLRVVFCAVVFKLLVWCGAEGYVSGLQDAAAT